MKKLLLVTAIYAVSFSTQAHRVWVQSEPVKVGEILQADIGYGEFPTLEPIAEKRLPFFDKGMVLVNAREKQNLVQKGENYHYESVNPLQAGSYILAAEYKPTFWSKNEEGWKQADMYNTPNATYCERTAMYGKNVLNVGNSTDKNAIAEVIGHELEIVPMENPATIKVGEHFKVVVLYQGEPLPNATLTATFKGFDKTENHHSHKVEAQAFSDTTGEDGTVDIIPLRDGFWKASVVYETPFEQPSQCQKNKHYATLTFDIAK